MTTNINNGFKPIYKEFKKINYCDISSSTFPILNTNDIGNFKSDFSTRVSYDDSSNISDNNKIKKTTKITIDELPGLEIFPNYLTKETEKELICNIFEEYLPEENHINNLDAHYYVPRPFNVFDKILQDEKTTLTPKSSDHKELSLNYVLEKKLRWVTLGGQYDWTAKKYPSFELNSKYFPIFPKSLSNILKPFMLNPEAAIINFYSPGDTLAPHQDIAEISDKELVSLSIGCSAIFLCGLKKSDTPLPVLLHSGDVIVMKSHSRKAWHGICRVFENTCPDYLQEDIYIEKKYVEKKNINKNYIGYSSWIKNHRINVNVRQVL